MILVPIFMNWLAELGLKKYHLTFLMSKAIQVNAISIRIGMKSRKEGKLKV